MALVLKNLPANAGDLRDLGSIPGMGRSLEKEMVTHSNNYKTEYLRCTYILVLFYINMTFENKNSMVSENLVKGECLVAMGH